MSVIWWTPVDIILLLHFCSSFHRVCVTDNLLASSARSISKGSSRHSHQVFSRLTSGKSSWQSQVDSTFVARTKNSANRKSFISWQDEAHFLTSFRWSNCSNVKSQFQPEYSASDCPGRWALPRDSRSPLSLDVSCKQNNRFLISWSDFAKFLVQIKTVLLQQSINQLLRWPQSAYSSVFVISLAIILPNCPNWQLHYSDVSLLADVN